MAQPVIYLDTSLLLNFTMDFLILALTARLSGYRTSVGRLILGSLIGSIYVLAIFLPELSFLYNMLIKFIYSALIVAVTFLPLRLKKFAVVLSYFYAVSFALGGAIYGFSALSVNLRGSSNYEVLANLVEHTGNFVDVLVWGFPLALLFWLTVGRWGWASLKRSVVQAISRFPLSISFAGIEVRLDGLVDTGNQLRDPLTKTPVVVVEVKPLLPYLPPEFAQIIFTMDIDRLHNCLEGTHWGQRLRLVPFISVGEQNGLMIGFVPDLLVIHTPAGEIKTSKVIIGLYAKELSHDGAYRALLHPDLLPAAG